MNIMPNGVAVIDGDTTNEWVKYAGVLYDPRMAFWLTRLIKRRSVKCAIDVGGHIGATTRPMLDAGCKVITFEANAEAADCLAHNCPEATVVNKALGETPGTKLLAKLPNAGANYVIKEGETDPTAVSENEVVEVTTLDDYYAGPGLNMPLPGLIKLDIEGSELAALKGAWRTITKCMPALVMEMNTGALERQGATPRDIYDWLHSHGYRWGIIERDLTFDSPHYNIEAMR
jgi:FkbM family methyltransferase